MTGLSSLPAVAAIQSRATGKGFRPDCPLLDLKFGNRTVFGLHEFAMTWLVRTRFALGVYIACFSVGAINHARDFLSYGWRPYSFGPPLVEAFWTSLLVLDVLVIVLIVANWRRSSLFLAAFVVVTDVSANAFASFVLEIPGFAVALPLQAAFLGFVLGSLPFLWPARS